MCMAMYGSALAQSVDTLMQTVVEAVRDQDPTTARAAIGDIDQLIQSGAAPPERDIGEIYRFLAQMNEFVGQPSASVTLLERGMALVEARGGRESEAHFMLRADLTNALLYAGNTQAALAVGEELKSRLAALGLNGTSYAFKNHVTLGSAYAQTGQMDAAITAYEAALSATAKDQREPMLELIARKGLSVFLVQTGQILKAISQAQQGYEFAKAQYGPTSAYALDFRIDHAFALIADNDTITAWNILDDTLSEALRSLGPDHAVTQRASENMAFFDAAQPNSVSALDGGSSGLEKLAELNTAADDARAIGDLQRLETTLLEIADLTRTSPEIGLDRHAEALEALVTFYSASSHAPQRAPHFLDTAIELLEYDLGPDHLTTLRMKRLAIERRMSEVRNFELFVAQFGPDIINRLSAHRRFWDGTEATAFYSASDVEVFRRYAEAHGEQDDFVSKLTATIRYAEVLDDVGRHDDATRTLSDLDRKLENRIAASGSIYEDLRVHVARARAQNLSVSGDHHNAVVAYRAAVPSLFETLRLSYMTVDALGDTITLLFGRSFGMDFAATAWLAYREGSMPVPTSRAVLFEAVQIAGYGPASAAVARSGLRKLMQNPDLADLAAQWRALTRVAQNDTRVRDVEQDWFRSAALDNLREAILKKAPEFYDMQVPDPVPLSDVRAKNMLAADEALIVLLPAYEFGKFANDPNLGGLVLALTQDGFAAAPIGLGSIEMTLQVARLHAELDRRPLAEEAALRSEGTRAPLNPAIDLPDNGFWQQSGYAFDRAHDLYAGLFGAPDIQALIADKPNWIVVAHGVAMSIPFPALITQATDSSDAPSVAQLRNAHWLGLERALTIVPSVDSWVSLKERGTDEALDSAAIAYLGVGDPAFEGMETASLTSASAVMRGGFEVRSSGLRSLPRLPGTRREVHRISTLFPDDRRLVLLGSDASETELRRLQKNGTLSDARILHFATHGLLAGTFDDLGEPALALSPPHAPTDPEHDGLLTASEAAALDLSAEWVILSACDTAGAESLNGDGLGGLAQGFFTAGARNLLVSHWRVDDLAAERLATATVQSAEAGAPKAEALRRAMQNLMNDTSRDHTPNSFAHPSQWAPFILVGAN